MVLRLLGTKMSIMTLAITVLQQLMQTDTGVGSKALGDRINSGY